MHVIPGYVLTLPNRDILFYHLFYRHLCFQGDFKF